MEKNVCKYCHRVYKGHAKPYTCPECSQMEEDMFDKIEAYLKQFPNSNAISISQGLGISTKDILNFIDEGRLTINKGTFERLS